MVHMIEDETSCGPLCQHPACWQSNLRREKGFYHKCHKSQEKKEIETDLPTLKIFNLFEEEPDNEKLLIQQPQRKTASVTSISGQNESKKSASVKEVNVKPPTLKMVEVQQMLDLTTAAASSSNKKYLVWVPNPNRKRPQPPAYQLKNTPESTWSQQETMVHPKDLTEHMIPKNIVSEHTQPKLQRTRNRSPVNRQYPPPKSPAMKSFKPKIDADGVRDLLNLSRDVFEEVLDHTRQSDFTSREKLHDVIHKFLPPLERDLSSLSMDSTDLLQPKKISLQQSQERFRRAHAMAPAQPIFHMDDGGFGGFGSSLNTPGRGTGPFGSDFFSIRDIYVNGVKDFGSKKPLPAIGDNQENGEPNTTPRLPSISLGLPEIPTGIRHTKPFTYRKITDVDFTLGPMPTPPTSVCTSEDGGSEHGTTILVTIPSAQSAEEEEFLQTAQYMISRSPLTPSAGTSTKIPKAPTTTPATAPAVVSARGQDRQSPARPPKHIQPDVSQSPTKLQKSPQSTDHPTDTQADAAMFRKEATSSVSNYKAVKSLTEIPEVPPPPSSPQDIEAGNTQTEESSPVVPVSRITSETPVTHGVSSEEQMPSMTPGPPHSAHTVSRPLHHRERSSVSSPEPWPTVHEDYYDIMHSPITKGKFHDNIPEGEMSPSDTNVHKKTEIKKLANGRNVEVPGPPPPSPESRELLKTDTEASEEEKRVLNSSESVTMTPLYEETKLDGQQEDRRIGVPTADFEPVDEDDKSDHGQPTQRTEVSAKISKEELMDETEVVTTKLSDSDIPENVHHSENRYTGSEGQTVNVAQSSAQSENEMQLGLNELKKDEETIKDNGIVEEGGINTERAEEELREEMRKLE